ncbi:uncharacterized protein Z520_09033 [Fonsecaea multimorphosa CBS 102226]|uniref:Uncharacterized protein n=1 Tax=Fonsecaea multimorphosa CBS 102226 TaxID=1442371 RepID=A0A0D2JP42_9EURO|nr:uncharacterized protein Z520_09033 [Fonsecaea multimorphosa CBS 102226]KIX95117.1 hypothetical protein Z520_09033 [Fonsecaea multimorphosa CBS 102226]OAL20838.1 hypothetical protein AYO22_08466 [Fonsecaea multimorphosa]
MFSILQCSAWVFTLFSLVLCDHNSSNIGLWDRPRAALIRDHVYLEGGYMQTGVWSNGAWKSLASATSSEGFLYKLSMHDAFDTTKANPALFQSINEGPISNYYLDGYMFADYDEFYAYGGMFYSSEDTTTDRTVNDPLYDIAPDSNIQAGVPNIAYSPDSGSFIQDITNGAGANAPSENLSFYFSGLYNENGTAFSYFNPPTDYSPYLIKVDTTNQGHAQWTRSLLTDSNITLRSEGALVWIPASTQGLLIAIGGVVYPSDLHFYESTDNATDVALAKTFVTEFPVYDIGSGQWSIQSLSPESEIPPNLAQFCTVVASSADYSHHEIFVYGGWDSDGNASYSDVWILSVPSFTWINTHAPGDPRQGHVCISPYPDQMIVIGGTGTYGAGLQSNNSVDVFNLNDLSWTGKYDPTVYDDYKPPATVMSVISATPTPSGMSSQVFGWFNQTYENKNMIKTWGPYSTTTSSAPANTATHTQTSTPHHHKDWVVPVAVTVPVVVGVAFFAGLIFLCCWRARKDRQQTQDTSEANNRKSPVWSWLRSTSSAAAGKDIGTESSITEVEHPHSPPPMAQTSPHELPGYFGMSGTGSNPERWSSSTPVRSPRAEYDGPVEGPNTEVHEVHGSSRITRPDDIYYDIRNMPMYPPSVVSGGQHRATDSSSFSPAGESNAPASPNTTSVGVASSSFAAIPEGEMALGDGHTSPFDRAISPIDHRRDPRPPAHGRQPSDVSSAPSLPSPGGEDQSALPNRPRASRSVSGDDVEIEEPGNRTI